MLKGSQLKESQLRELLDAAVQEPYAFEGVKESPRRLAYRYKMEFSFGDEYKDGPLSLGLHKKGSTYDVLTASDCKLVHPDMTAILSSVLDFFTELGAVHYKKMQHTGYLRHLLLRRGVTSGEILVHVITTSQAEYDYAPLVSRLLALPLEGKIVERVSGVRLSRDGGIISAQEIEIQLLHSRERFIVRRLFFNRLLRGRRFFHRYILRLKARAGKEVRRRHKNTAFSKFKAGRKTPASPRRTGRAAAGRRLSAMALFYSIPHAHASPAGKKAAFLREV